MTTFVLILVAVLLVAVYFARDTVSQRRIPVDLPAPQTHVAEPRPIQIGATVEVTADGLYIADGSTLDSQLLERYLAAKNWNDGQVLRIKIVEEGASPAGMKILDICTRLKIVHIAFETEPNKAVEPTAINPPPSTTTPAPLAHF